MNTKEKPHNVAHDVPYTKEPKELFNNGYIKASDEAYNLLVKLGHKPIEGVPRDCDYYYIGRDRIRCCSLEYAEMSYLTPFYINKGKLSWEEEDENSGVFSDSDTTMDNVCTGSAKDTILSIKDEQGKELKFNTHGYKIKFFEVIENFIHGAIYIDDEWWSCEWDFLGQFLRCTYSGSERDYDITPTKPKWYEDESNFPCLMVNQFGRVHEVESMDHLKRCEGWRLATKAEALALVVEE